MVAQLEDTSTATKVAAVEVGGVWNLGLNAVENRPLDIRNEKFNFSVLEADEEDLIIDDENFPVPMVPLDLKVKRPTSNKMKKVNRWKSLNLKDEFDIGKCQHKDCNCHIGAVECVTGKGLDMQPFRPLNEYESHAQHV